MKDKTVLISGAGVAGPALAFWLHLYGFHPTLIEKAPAPRKGGYAIDFWGAGFEVAQRMGLLLALRERDLRIKEVRFVDAQGRRSGGFNVEAIRYLADDQFVSLPRSDLAAALFESVRNDVECLFGNTIQSFQQDDHAVSVSFCTGPSRCFDLLVGADGLHSAVRTMQFGPEEQYEHFYGYYAAAYTLENYSIAGEHAYLTYSIPRKQAALYRLKEGRTGVFFIFASPRLEKEILRQPETQKELLAQTFADAGWECPALLQQLPQADDFYFDAVSQIRMPTWSNGRVALLGDAAFCPSLLSGQGAALAMAGAYVLAGELKAAQGDHVVAFERYNQKLRPFIESKQKSAEKFARSLVPSTRPGIWIRDQVTRLMFLPFVSRMVFRQFMQDRFTLEEY